MKKLLSIIFLSCGLMLFTHLTMAQGPEDPGEDPDIPIDGGVGLLVAAGLAYGGKKLHEYRKNAKQ